MRRRALKKRYGHTGGRLSLAYTHRQSPHALIEIVYRDGREVGTVMLLTHGRWRWAMTHRSFSGYTRTLRGGVKKVIEAVEHSIARSL